MTTKSIFNLLFDDFYDCSLKTWDFDGFKSIKTEFPHYPVSNVKYDKEKENLIFEIAVTGFDKDEIEISVSGNCLTINGAIKNKQEENENVFYIHKSLAKRNFNETWRIDERMDLNKLQPKLENGLLTIIIPIKEQEKAKVIKIA